MYVRDISSGITVSDQEPCVVSEKAAVAHVDGCNLLGPVVGDFSMQLAINKAKAAGIGLVSAKS
jgi:LDH2 family malate/lactate/ureidoglycolate dehydrogenase